MSSNILLLKPKQKYEKKLISLHSVMIAVCILVVFVNISCNKDEQFNVLETTAKVESVSMVEGVSSVLEEARTWYSKQNNSKLFVPDWQQNEMFALENGNKVLAIKLKRVASESLTDKIGFLRSLVIEYDNKMNIKEGTIMEIIGDGNFIKTNKKNIISERNGNSITGFTGSAITSNLAYTEHIGKTYRDGRVKGKASILRKVIDSKNARMDSACIDWFLVITYEDGSVTSVYLYTTCYDGQTINPEDGGGAGIVDASGIDAILNSFHAVSVLRSESTIYEDGNTMKKSYQWTCGQSPLIKTKATKRIGKQ